tara:strand:+ start:30814 stop:32208 length:1395 start_codon:yes stop_codon:yes gene_type:complete
VVFAASLIVVIVINTNYIIDQSYTSQDLRYDLNYSIYSASLITENGDAEGLLNFLKKNSFGLNFLFIKNGVVVEKNPPSFFKDSKSLYVNPLSAENHPYYSFSDFNSLSNLLGDEELALPRGVLEISSGGWIKKDGSEHPTDFIETSNGSRVYIISSSPFEEDGFFVNSLGGGLIVGVVAIIIFILAIYYYIRVRLRPIKLMKNRILSLQKGDLDSKIQILGNDELAEVSVTFNKLISEIKKLIEQKHRVLLDVSHELKTPLTRMLLMVEMSPGMKNKESFRQEINFLNDLVSNLLLSDKLQIPYDSLDLEKVDFLKLIKEVISYFTIEEQESICLKNEASTKNMFVDKIKTIVAIKNVLQNAVKYGKTQKGIDVVVSDDGINILTTIRDYGAGITNKDTSKIFDAFFRSKKTAKASGLGLGLAISKKIIESHCGTLKLNTNIDVGAEFIIALPIKNDAQKKFK